MTETIVTLNQIEQMITVLRQVVLSEDNTNKAINYANTFLGFFGLRNDVGNILSAISLGFSFGTFFMDLESNCDAMIDTLEDCEDILQNNTKYDLLKFNLELKEISYYTTVGGATQKAIIPTKISLIGIHATNGWIMQA